VSRLRVAFCVSGRGSLFQAAIREARAIGIAPVLLVTDITAAGELDAFAASNAVPSVRLDPAEGPAFNEALAEHLDGAEPDLVVLTFDRIVPAGIVRRYAGRMINVHPALLPAFAGTRAIERTIRAGVLFAGATIHEVVEAVDAGPVVAQAVVPIEPADDIDAYGRRMYEILEPMFLQVLRWYAEGRVTHDGSGRVRIQGARYGELPVSPAIE
jgi:phosphoribosylglycinamide formyltransferase-1